MIQIKKNWDDKVVKSCIEEHLLNYDDGELFIEEVFSENILFDDNKIKNASFDHDKGFGLRGVSGESVNFTHNSELSEDAINSAIKFIKNPSQNPSKKRSSYYDFRRNLRRNACFCIDQFCFCLSK